MTQAVNDQILSLAASKLTGTVALANGGTASNLSATGGTGHVLKQSSVGAAVTVGVLAGSDITGAALTKVDDTNVTLTLTGSPTVALLAATGLTIGWTGVLSVARGGIGVGTLASNGVIYGNGTGAVLALAVNAGAKLFLTQTSSAAPAWAAIVAGDVPTLNQNTTGSAATLTTPRAINGVNFDGSAAITVTAAAGTLTGTVLNATVVTSSLTSVGALAAGSITTGFGTIVTANKVAIGAAAVDASSMLIVGSAGEAQATIWADMGSASSDTDAFLRFVIDVGKTLKGLMGYDQGLDRFILGYNGTSGLRIDSSGNLEIPVNLSKYRAITTAGWGIPAIYGSGRSVAQVAAVASVATYTLTAADASFLIGANVNVTTSTLHNFTVTVGYTDEGNTARTLTLTFSQLTGALVTAITNVTGAGPYEGITMQIRCKASTAITVATIGTFTTLVYNVEASIQQVS